MFLLTFQVGRLHCLLPWWEDATVDFMINGGYNVVNLIKQVLKNNEIGYGALQRACILVIRIQTLILNLEWAIQAVQCDVNLKICLIIGFYMYLFYSLLCIGGVTITIGLSTIFKCSYTKNSKSSYTKYAIRLVCVLG